MLACGLSWIVGVATVRRAEACQPEAPFIEAVAPKKDAKGVPTNAKIWIRGSALAEVTITPTGGAAIALTLERLPASTPTYRASPPAALLPNTTYVVAAKMLEQPRTEGFGFTTGTGADETAPMAPAMVQVVTTEILSPPTNCWPEDGYRLKVSGPEVAGAVMYELEALEDGVFVVSNTSPTPNVITYERALPSRTFRLRPISITGVRANEAALPTAMATRADDTVGERPEAEDVSGCSASSGSSGSLLALVLGALVLGASSRSARKRASHRAAAAALLSLATLLVSVAAPRRAEACSQPLPTIHPLHPEPGQVAVATNAHLWLGDAEVTEVTLSTGDVTLGVELVSLLPSRLVHVRPLQALQPRTKYDVLAKGADGVASVRYEFTTGDGALPEQPAAPSNLRVRAYRPPSPQNSCAPSGPFVVDINAQAAANGAFYLLQVQVGDHFESLGYSITPSFTLSASQLPSPVYRIQAVSLTGAFADEATLSTGRATEEQDPPADDGDDDRSACSAAPGDSGSALALLLGGVGWALWQRRRKRALGIHRGISAQ